MDLGPVSRFLSPNIVRNCKAQTIDINQIDYIQSILKQFDMADCRPARTPLPAGAVLEKFSHTAANHSQKWYQSLIGSQIGRAHV